MAKSEITFSVISAVYNKEAAMDKYLEAFDRQNWRGCIEVVLVDDCSSDNSVGVARAWQKKWDARADRNLILIENNENLGNCGSRNIGLSMASGEVICIIDADCIVNQEFVRSHFTALKSGADISIGPMGIELGFRKLRDLEKLLADDPARRLNEMKLQWSEEPEAFLNCVTRNFTVSKSFLAKISEPLFNEEYSFRKSDDTGFGWEDVDMGARLYKHGANIQFNVHAYTIHLTHPPEVADEIKARGSAINFARLLEKHPKISVLYPDWATHTLSKIENWLAIYDDGENVAVSRAKGFFEKYQSV